jgi:hypothetical protein
MSGPGTFRRAALRTGIGRTGTFAIDRVRPAADVRSARKPPLNAAYVTFARIRTLPRSNRRELVVN